MPWAEPRVVRGISARRPGRERWRLRRDLMNANRRSGSTTRPRRPGHLDGHHGARFSGSFGLGKKGRDDCKATEVRVRQCLGTQAAPRAMTFYSGGKTNQWTCHLNDNQSFTSRTIIYYYTSCKLGHPKLHRTAALTGVFQQKVWCIGLAQRQRHFLPHQLPGSSHGTLSRWASWELAM